MKYWNNKSLQNIIYFDENGVKREEVWKDIDGYIGFYAVSNLGRVKSYSRLVEQPTRNKVNKRKERILSQTIDRYGYCKISLSVNKIRKYTVAHILVACAFIPNIYKKDQVNHRHGNKKDNRVWQLEWNTAKENSNHAISIGVDSVVGEHNGRAILTEKDVLEIRHTYVTEKKYGLRQKLSKKYNMSEGLITKIHLGHLWKHLL